MIYIGLILIVINAPVEQPPPVEQPIEPDPGLIQWHCPDCTWWNAYETTTALKIGSRAHVRRCKGSKKLFE